MIQVFLPLIREESIRAVEGVLRSGWIGLGPKVGEFEKGFSEYLGVENAVALNSCTSALHMALVLGGVGIGDNVITTANTFVSTNHAIKYVGANPIFCDIELETGNIDTIEIDRIIDRGVKVKAIVCVHFGGYPCDLSRLAGIAEECGILLIEDCAHASGAEYCGKKVGQYGDFGCFSFQAVKNLPVGDGGMLVAKDDDMIEKAKKMRWLGIDKSTYDRTDLGEGRKKKAYAWQYDVPFVGYKYHMNDISAAIGVEQLKYLDVDNRRRREICERYMRELGDVYGLRLPEYMVGRKSSYHFMPILVEHRNELIEKLKGRDIHVGVHYVRNDSYVVYEKFDLYNTELFTKQEITLPCHCLLSDDDVGLVIQTIKEGW